MRIITTALGLVALCAATPAIAAPLVYSFNTTGNTNTNGAYGNALSFSSTSGSSTLQMQVTAWQSNQSTNDITRAYLGAFSTGLGVTGINDSNGASNYHQFDNARGYTDFVMLEFSRAVSLTGVTLNTYNLGSSSGKDSDLAFYNAASIAGSNLTAYDTVPSAWTAVNGSGGSGYVSLGSTGTSTKWLVGAAFIPTNDRDDGFKIASVKVSEVVSAVPEPETWAMMLMGFGAVGGALRAGRRARKGGPADRVVAGA
jgi:hypothetical protein